MISEIAKKLKSVVPTYEGVGGLTCEICPVKDECDKMNADPCIELLEEYDDRAYEVYCV